MAKTTLCGTREAFLGAVVVARRRGAALGNCASRAQAVLNAVAAAANMASDVAIARFLYRSYRGVVTRTLPSADIPAVIPGQYPLHDALWYKTTPTGFAITHDGSAMIIVHRQSCQMCVVATRDGVVLQTIGGFHFPGGVSVAPDGTVFVADAWHVRSFTPQFSANPSLSVPVHAEFRGRPRYEFVAVGASDAHVVCGGSADYLCVFSRADGCLTSLIEPYFWGADTHVESLCFFRDGRRLAVALPYFRRVDIVSFEGVVLCSISISNCHSLARNVRDELVVASHEDKVISVFDAGGTARRRTFAVAEADSERESIMGVAVHGANVYALMFTATRTYTTYGDAAGFFRCNVME